MGLVKISVSCLFMSMDFITMSPFSTWSLKKWCLISMCFALPWKTGLWARHMALESSHMRGTLLQVISHGMHYPKNLGATASSNYILGLCGGLCDRRLFMSRPTNKRRSKKTACVRSALSVNPTTHKISIRKANKIK
jgi:hypothetical protein